MNSTEPVPLPDERVLEMTGIRLAELTGKEWRLESGPLLKGPGTAGVRVGPRHSGSHRHIDLEFLLNVDRADETSLPDCATGLAADPEEVGDDSTAKQMWVADTRPWAELAPVIADGLTRPFLNGVRLFIGQGGDFEDCEVKINGHLHEPSAAALAAMNWPRTAKMSTAKVFLLLVHPQENGDK